MELRRTESGDEIDRRPGARHRKGSMVLMCATCGCRLTARESRAAGGGYGPDAAWRHFEGNSWDRDARGHLVVCADMPHVILPTEEYEEPD
ncbi:MAG: hypothetical protein ABSB75_00495 [Candidatus Limnocylindrales bacterium]